MGAHIDDDTSSVTSLSIFSLKVHWQAKGLRKFPFSFDFFIG